MNNGFELSSELISTLCRQHGVEYNKNYSYSINDVPGGVQVRISDPQTGDKIDEFITYSDKPVESGFSDVEKDILKRKNENSYIRQCISLIYAIIVFGLLAAGIMIFGMRYIV